VQSGPCHAKHLGWAFFSNSARSAVSCRCIGSRKFGNVSVWEARLPPSLFPGSAEPRLPNRDTTENSVNWMRRIGDDPAEIFAGSMTEAKWHLNYGNSAAEYTLSGRFIAAAAAEPRNVERLAGNAPAGRCTTTAANSSLSYRCRSTSRCVSPHLKEVHWNAINYKPARHRSR